MASIPQSKSSDDATLPFYDPANQPLRELIVSSARGIQRAELIASILTWAVVILGVVVASIVVDQWVWPIPGVVRGGLWLAIVLGTFYWFGFHVLSVLRRPIHPEYAAWKIEQAMPGIHNGLINWVQLASQPSAAPKGILQTIARQVFGFVRSEDSVGISEARVPKWLVLLSACIVTLAIVYSVVSPKPVSSTLTRLFAPWLNTPPATRVRIVDVAPGNAIVTEGEPLRIAIQVRGWIRGDQAIVRYSSDDGQIVDAILEMQADVEGYQYFADLGKSSDGVRQPLRYDVEAGDAKAGPFVVDVVPVPLVNIERIDYDFPKYTNLEKRTSLATGEIVAPEGTRVTVHGTANLPVKRARLEFDSRLNESTFDVTKALDVDVDSPRLIAGWQLQCDEKRSNPSLSRYRFNFETDLGETNPNPFSYRIQVNPDLPPEIAIDDSIPDSYTVALDDEAVIPITAWDSDFGLTHITLKATLQSNQSATKTLFENEAGVLGRVTASYRLNPKALRLQPNQTLDLVAMAEDNRHVGNDERFEPNVRQSRTIRIKIAEARKTESKTATASKKATNDPTAKNPGGDDSTKSKNGKSDRVDQGGKPNSDQDGSKTQPNSSNDPRNNKSDADPGQSIESPTESHPSEPSNDNKSPSTESNSQEGTSSSDESIGGSQSGAQSAPDQGASGSQGVSENGENSNGAGSKNGASQSNSSAGQSGSSPSGTSGGGSNDSSAENSQASNSSSSSKPGSKNDSSSGNSLNPANDANESTDESTPPTHDGEVFERVQKWMDESGQSTPSQSSDSQNSISSDSASSKSGANSKSNDQANQPKNSRDSANDNDDPAQPNAESSSASKANSQRSSNNPPKNGSKQPSSTAAGSEQDESSKAANEGSPSNEDSSSNASGNNQGNHNASTKNPSNGKNGEGAGSKTSSSEKSDARSDSKGKSTASDSKESNTNLPGTQSGDSTELKPTQPEGSQVSDDATGSHSSSASASKQKNDETNSKETNDGSSSKNASTNQTENDSSAGSSDAQQSSSESTGNEGKQGDSSDTATRNEKSGGSTKSAEQGSKSTPNGEPGNSSKAAGNKAGTASAEGSTDQATNSNDNQSSQEQAGNKGSSSSQSTSKENRGNLSGQSRPNAPSGSHTESTSNHVDSAHKERSEAEVEYARQATDMLLDALNRQRNQPDPELLRRTQMSREQLDAFIERWNRAKEEAMKDPSLSKKYEDALKSLGLMPQGRASTQDFDKDQLGGLREQGQRVLPPESLRRRYEQFRRSIE